MWKKIQPSQHKICRQSIGLQKIIWEHHIWCHVEISEVATLVSMILNFWCSVEVAAAELHLCFVINGNVWWKRIFLPMVYYRCVTSLTYKAIQTIWHLQHMLFRGQSEKFLSVDSQNERTENEIALLS